MPITLVTGKPGNGKTLWMLSEVEKLRKESGRDVYFHNIPGLALPWIELENPALWYEVPAGSIIVMDEAQRVFPNRHSSATVPKKVSEWETHRHKGIDAYLLTQAPNLIDFAVRELTQRHVHLKRPFGMDWSNVYEFNDGVKTKPEYSKDVALVSKFFFPKEVYSWYKSADLHTVKKTVPYRKLVFLGGLVLAVVVLFYIGLTTTFSIGDDSELPSSAPAPASESSSFVPRSFDVSSGVNSGYWTLKSQTPVIEGHPYTKPFYDGAIKVTAIPKISGCQLIEMDGLIYHCSCNTQQGTRIQNMPVHMCVSYVRNGWFDFNPDPDREQDSRQQVQPAPAPTSLFATDSGGTS